MAEHGPSVKTLTPGLSLVLLSSVFTVCLGLQGALGSDLQGWHGGYQVMCGARTLHGPSTPLWGLGALF